MKEFSDIFKTELTIHNRIDLPPVNIKTVANQASFRPTQKTTAIDTPLHLQSAAAKELSNMLKAGFLEESHHSAPHCSRGFFVAKPNSDNLKARLVADFRDVNRILKRPGYPMDGSSLILKRLNPDEAYFSTLDLSSRYHQIRLAEASRDLFTIILPQGKYRYTVFPQGTSSSCDIFNIIFFYFFLFYR